MVTLRRRRCIIGPCSGGVLLRRGMAGRRKESMTDEAADKKTKNGDALGAAAVVHDVNQMLAVITGRAGLLLKRAEDAELARHLEAILLASGDAATMLRRLGTGTGAAAEMMPPAGSRLKDVGEQARLLVWPADGGNFQWKNLLENEAAAAVSPQVLREVLSNLLLNALGAMPAGGEVVLSQQESGDDRILVRVADNGPGLPAGDPEQVFVAGVSSSGEKGRGLGLAGCRQLLKRAGGRLSAESNQGSGAVFILDLPRGNSAALDRKNSETPSLPRRVLVVDDEAGVREMLGDVLAELGCEVQACRDGRQTLAEYKPGSAEVALIDLNLPGLSGLELATRLRVGDPCLSIVMVTGWEQDDSLAAADSSVVDQKASKPMELTTLRDILNQGQRLHQERRAGGPSS